MYSLSIGRRAAVPPTASFAWVPVPLATRIGRRAPRRSTSRKPVEDSQWPTPRQHRAQLSCLSNLTDRHNRVWFAVAPLDMCAGFGAALAGAQGDQSRGHTAYLPVCKSPANRM
jgi:hypothetical protein